MNNDATLVLLGIYHGQANPDRIIIADIDKLITMADKFEDRCGDTDWEHTEYDWADTLARWYNDTKDSDWNIIPMVSDDPYFKVKQEMDKYLSFNDDEEYDIAIKTLKSALKLKKKRDWLIDNVEGITVRDKVKYDFTVTEFCKLIGLTNKN